MTLGTNHHICLVILSYILAILSSRTTAHDNSNLSAHINNGLHTATRYINLLLIIKNKQNRSAPYALSTINFTKEFIHENNNKSPSSKLSIATNNNRGVNGIMSSSNISVDASTNSKQSKSSTIKSSSTGTTNRANKAENKQHYIPQTIPVNLSISRSGKMILLGKFVC